MREVMQEGQHYGTIPGCGDKPCLLKPGAEKLGLTFRLIPQVAVTLRELVADHREYEVKVTLVHEVSGRIMGEGVGCCSTRESKYRWRKAERTCPLCEKPTIFRSKQEPGWFCWNKKGGCGATFKPGDPAVEKQELGRVENPDPADCYNTVLKMAKKRALVDAMITATAASDIFTQDLEEDAPPNQPTSGVVIPPGAQAPSAGNGKAPAPPSSEQRAKLAAYRKSLGDDLVRQCMGRLGITAQNITADNADLLLGALNAETEAHARPDSGPPMTTRQKEDLTALETHLGIQAVNAAMTRCGIKARDMTERDAALLIDTLMAEAEARAEQQTPSQAKSPGDLPPEQGPPQNGQGDVWDKGRE
jgi:hypothetical protein